MPRTFEDDARDYFPSMSHHSENERETLLLLACSDFEGGRDSALSATSTSVEIESVGALRFNQVF